LNVVYKKSKKSFYTSLNKILDSGEKKFIITANPETIVYATKDSLVNDMLFDSSNLIVPDGIAIVKAAKILKIDIKERISGIDIAEHLLEIANNKKKSLYLFGAKEEVVKKLVEIIKYKYPKIKVLGYTNGYIDNKDEEMKRIISLNPDICLVALGIPGQEKLIYNNISLIKKGIYMGVGGSFDVMSGIKKRAPKIFIKMNLEWLYIICKEPKRLKRFYNNNIKFLYKVFQSK
jgi:N-acetylglucosaminyldiphosphoundecaprenol N-acetyl-beta-D-mannosaminyltransferase